MPFATLPGVWLSQGLERVFDLNTPLLVGHSPVLLALLLGLGYCLAELPNSFIKRRLGIKEGKTSDKAKWFFVVLDQADSAFGCILAYSLIIPLSFMTMMLSIICGTVLHLIINISLYAVGIRKNAF